ncbi:MAG: type II toxin-antitoxin system VapB family antitoxin [Methylorubrum populi]
MSLTIDGEEVDQLAEQLAALLQVDETEAVRMALLNELQLCEASLADETKSYPSRQRYGTAAAESDTVFEADIHSDPT